MTRSPACLFLTLDDEDMLTLTSSFSKPIVLVNGDDPVDAALQRYALQPLRGAPWQPSI